MIAAVEVPPGSWWIYLIDIGCPSQASIQELIGASGPLILFHGYSSRFVFVLFLPL
jgi:hypothetical protein